MLKDQPIYRGTFYLYGATYKKKLQKRIMSVNVMKTLLTGHGFTDAHREFYEQMPEGLQVLADAIREHRVKIRDGVGVGIELTAKFLPMIRQECLLSGEELGADEMFDYPKRIPKWRPDRNTHARRMAEYLQWWWRLQKDLSNGPLAELAKEVGVHKSIFLNQGSGHRVVCQELVNPMPA